jgi:hypothetical protein
MEIPLAFGVTGFILLLATGIRLRKYFSYRDFQERLRDRVNTENMDFSGETEYSRCFAHRWLMENVMLRKHGKFGQLFQSYLMYNTLSATLWLSMIGVVVLILYLFFIHAIMVIGFAIAIFFIGGLLVVGPSTPHISSLFLADIINTDIENLNEEDFVYVKLANESILQWVFVSTFFGFSFIIVAPWGDSIPMFLAGSIATFTAIFIIAPATMIAEFSLPIAIVYVASVLPIFMICIAKSLHIIRKKIHPKMASISREA